MADLSMSLYGPDLLCYFDIFTNFMSGGRLLSRPLGPYFSQKMEIYREQCVMEGKLLGKFTVSHE